MKTWRDGWSYLLGAKHPSVDQDVCSARIRQLVDRGVSFPAMLDVSEVQELCVSLSHYYALSRTPLFSPNTLFSDSGRADKGGNAP